MILHNPDTKWIWSRRSPLPAAEQVSLPQLQPHHSPQAGTAGLAGMGRVREAGGRGSFGKCSRFRAPPTCSTLRRSARSTSPRCRRRCSRPGAATQRSHSVRGEEGTDRSPSWPGAPGGTASSTPSPITLTWSHQSMPMVNTLQSQCPT